MSDVITKATLFSEAIEKGPLSREDVEAYGGDHCRKCNASVSMKPGGEPTALCHHCAQEAAELLPSLLAEIERMGRHLPLTDDRVRVAVGEVYYAIVDDGESKSVVDVVYVGNCDPWVDFKWSVANPKHGPEERFNIVGVYSTRTAANAAK